MTKKFSVTQYSSRKIKRKDGGVKTIRVQPHVNKINRKPRKK